MKKAFLLFLLLPGLLAGATLRLRGDVIDSNELPAVKTISPRGTLTFIGIQNPEITIQKDLLKEQGLILLGYVPENAYLAFLLPEAEKLLARGTVTWAREVPASVKISPRVTRDGNVLVRLVGDSVSLPADATILWKGQQRMILECTRQTLQTLAKDPRILWIEPLPRLTMRNDISSWVVQSDIPYLYSIHNRGLLGEGQIVGHIDGTPSVTSCYFVDPEHPIGPDHRKIVALRNDGNSYPDGHGTHTAGTVAGFAEGEVHNGLAPSSRISHTTVDTIIPYGTTSLYDAFVAANTDGAHIHTNSWGDDFTTEYTEWCADIDAFSHEYEDDLVMFASTNGASLKTPENAKNVLAVGATDQYPGEKYHYSGGMGPTFDGRLKPEIFAPGHSINSATAHEKCGTVRLSGTSMASPAVAAAATLIREYFLRGFYPEGKEGGQVIHPSGSLLKALLLSAGRDMLSSDGYPNVSEGWGYLVADDILYFEGEERKVFVSDIRHEEGLTDSQLHSYDIFVRSSDQPLRIALTWADEPAVPFATELVINNLDLRVSSPTHLYYGNHIENGESIPGGEPDELNNVEQVMFTAPETGVYTLEVVATQVPLPKQGYALVVAGDINFETGVLYPGVAGMDGMNDTFWVSDMTLANFSEEPVSLSVQYQEAGMPVSPGEYSLSAEGLSTLYLPDVISSFGLENTFGYLRIPALPGVEGIVRTFNQRPDGRYGQNILPASKKMKIGIPGYLPGIYQNSERRTNLGWINDSPISATVAMELLSLSGSRLAGMEVTLPAGRYIQKNLMEYFPGMEISGATLKLALLSGANVSAYASVITSHTGDAVFIPTLFPTTSGFLPVAASTEGPGGSRWRTELTVHNPTGEEAEISFHGRLMSNQTWKTYKTTIPAGPGETLCFTNLLRDLYQLETAFGYISVEGETVAAGRIYSGEDISASVGQFQGLTDGPEVSRWRLLTFPGESRRTNVGVVNRSSTPRFCAFKPLGSDLQKIVGIPAEALGQWNVSTFFETPGSAWVVDCDGPVYVYASSIDNESQDAVFLPGFPRDDLGYRW